MSTFITLLSLATDNFVLYSYFQTMFENRKEKIHFYWLLVAFLFSDCIFWALTFPLYGEVTNMAAFIRTFLTNAENLLLSFFFVSGILYRILIILSYSILISICEELAYYLLSHFTDVTIQFDSLPEITFTSISFICNLLMFFIIMIIHVVKKGKTGVSSKKYAVLLTLVPAMSCTLVLLPSFFDMNKTNPHAYLILVIFLLVINIVNYILLQSVSRAETLARETEKLTEQITYQRQKYRQLGDAYKNIRGFMHDTKKHLFYIESCVNEGRYDQIIPYARETMSDLENRYCTVNTGNLVIDAFISNLMLQTSQHNIKLTTKLKIDNALVPCDDYHMTIILGNLLDNALNACLEEQGGEININIQTVEHTFTIYITNTYHFTTGNIAPKNIENVDFIHGYGLKNVKNSAEACGGFCLINYEKGIYSVTVIIPEKERTLPPAAHS